MLLNEDLVSCIIVPRVYLQLPFAVGIHSLIFLSDPLLLTPAVDLAVLLFASPDVCLLRCPSQDSCYLRTLGTAFSGPLLISHLVSTLKYFPSPCRYVCLPLSVCLVRTESISLAVGHHSASYSIPL